MTAADQPIPSVWTRPRKQREQLSREQIVAEAVALLDADGLEALSMRKLGTRLGAGATSLYRHVANKDELIELVVDEIYGELSVPGVGDPAAEGPDAWRNAAAGVAHGLRDMVLRHPWVASVLGQVGLVHLGPNVTEMTERMLVVFRTAGFSDEETNRAMGSVIAYVIGMAISEAAYLSLIARSGRSEQDFIASLGGEPGVEAGKDPAAVREESFAYGLDRMLDGLALRVDKP
ncbi:TetR/AcrR family transcriptional regulator [Streptomyces sp. NPDC050504]|uniref:TetR/AcrR family transcriptional regulator n=1 Tax=Streptomyces sp. NPDC050504 TaxID=3365618 RepID=UPI0037A4EC3B